MHRVDFYVLESSSPDSPMRVACRIAEKAWLTGHTVYVATASEKVTRDMDQLLWTYRQDSFTPHGTYPEHAGEDLPILIGHGDHPPDAQVLLNLTGTLPPFHEHFERIAEFVSGDEPARRAGRERFRLYRDTGYDIHSHRL